MYLHFLLHKIGTKSESEALREWNDALEEMFGHDETLKANFQQMALVDKGTPEKAKLCIKSLL
jgi:hypothetical protein